MDLVLTEPQAWAIGAVLVMMLLDIVSGFVQACVNHCVESTKMREGVLHKASIALVIAATYAVELASSHVTGLDLGGLGVVTVCAVTIVMEFVSVWENACKACPDLKDSPLGRLIGASVGDDAE